MDGTRAAGSEWSDNTDDHRDGLRLSLGYIRGISDGNRTCQGVGWLSRLICGVVGGDSCAQILE